MGVSMKQLGFIAAIALFGTASAAAQQMSSTQSFYVTYESHGSTGSQEISLYDGPYILDSVKITWTASVGTGFEDPYADDTPYIQKYSGGVGFYMYNEDDHSAANGASAFKDFSGSKICTYSECDIDFTASGSLFAAPSEFQGAGTLVIDSGSYIDPVFTDGEYSGSGSELYGTITYYYGGVPEPATWALLVGGFGMVGGAMRSGRKTAVSFS